MKKVVVLILALIMTMSLVACGGSSEGSAAAESDSYIDQIKAKGELVVGTSADYPPYEFHTEIDGVDTIVGFDISIAQAIADDLGVELKIVDMSFENLLMSLSNGEFDMVTFEDMRLFRSVSRIQKPDSCQKRRREQIYNARFSAGCQGRCTERHHLL